VWAVGARMSEADNDNDNGFTFAASSITPEDKALLIIINAKNGAGITIQTECALDECLRALLEQYLDHIYCETDFDKEEAIDCYVRLGEEVLKKWEEENETAE